MTEEGTPVGERGETAEEGEPPGIVERHQPGEKETAEQLPEDAHG